MTPEFAPAVREAVAIYRETYGRAVRAIYVSGSVHRGEAVLGLSDLDLYPWVDAPPERGAQRRLRRLAEARLAAWAPANELKAARPLDWLAGARVEAAARDRARAWRRWCRAAAAGRGLDATTRAWERYVGLAATLRYDATLVYGGDVLAGQPIPAPDAILARMFVGPPLRAVRLACQGQEDPASPLPTDPAARLRKLARRAVLLGDLVLAAWGRPGSPRGTDVLPALAEATPRWAAFLGDTARCYIQVRQDAPTYEQYLDALAGFAEWCRQEIAAATPECMPP